MTLTRESEALLRDLREHRGASWHLSERLAAIEAEARAPLEAEVERLRALVSGGIVAFQLTREYVGADTLPEVAGWSWYDWCEAARAAAATPVAPAPAFDAGADAHAETYRKGWEAGHAEVERLRAALLGMHEASSELVSWMVATGQTPPDLHIINTALYRARAALAATPVAPAPNQPTPGERCAYRGKFEGRACVRPAGHTGAHSSIEPAP